MRWPNEAGNDALLLLPLLGLTGVLFSVDARAKWW